MATCPKCNKTLTECTSWPAWGIQLCILTHRALDCAGMDDIREDLDLLGAVRPAQGVQIASLSKKLEIQLRKNAGSPNPKCLTKLSNKLAAEIVSGPNASRIRHMLRTKLKVYA